MTKFLFELPQIGGGTLWLCINPYEDVISLEEYGYCPLNAPIDVSPGWRGGRGKNFNQDPEACTLVTIKVAHETRSFIVRGSPPVVLKVLGLCEHHI